MLQLFMKKFKKFYCFIFCIVIFTIFRPMAGMDDQKQKIIKAISRCVDTFISDVRIQISGITAIVDEQTLYRARTIPSNILYDILNAIQDVIDADNPNNRRIAKEKAIKLVEGIIKKRKNALNEVEGITDNEENPLNDSKKDRLEYYNRSIDLLSNFILFNAQTNAIAAVEAANIADANAKAAKTTDIYGDSLLESLILVKIAANAALKYAGIAEDMNEIFYLAGSSYYDNNDKQMKRIIYVKDKVANANKVFSNPVIAEAYNPVIAEAAAETAKKFPNNLVTYEFPIISFDKILLSLNGNSSKEIIEKILSIQEYATNFSLAIINSNFFLTIFENILLNCKADNFRTNISKANDDINKIYTDAYKALSDIQKAINLGCNNADIDRVYTHHRQEVYKGIKAMNAFLQALRKMKIDDILLINDIIIKNINDINILISNINRAIESSSDISSLLSQAKTKIKDLIKNIIALNESLRKSGNSIAVLRINMLKNIFLFLTKARYEASCLNYNIATKINSGNSSSNQIASTLFNAATKSIKKANALLEIMRAMNDALSQSDIKLDSDMQFKMLLMQIIQVMLGYPWKKLQS